MALVGTDRGTGTNGSTGTSFTLAPTSNFGGGFPNAAVLVIASDNSASGGTAYGTHTVTDTIGNTWVRVLTALYDPGAANAGVYGSVFLTHQDVGTLQTTTTITVSYGGDAPTVKAWTLMEIGSNVTGGCPLFLSSGTNTGSATTTPTVNISVLTAGDMAIGCLFNEYGTAQTITGDADATSGSWSTQQTAEIGSTAAGMSVSSQRKVTTAAGTQTYNPTLATSSDVILGWLTFGEVDPNQWPPYDNLGYY